MSHARNLQEDRDGADDIAMRSGRAGDEQIGTAGGVPERASFP